MKDPLLETYTEEELQIEAFMDLIEEDPQQAFPRGDMGNVQFRTGDPLIDEWEKKLAEGKESEIDWDAGVDPVFLAKLKEHSKRVANPNYVSEKMKEQAATLPIDDQEDFLNSLVGGFSDDYT